jgi:hypothetical protein
MTDPSNPSGPASLKAWANEATRQRRDLHFQRTSESVVAKGQAFALMSALAAEGIALVKHLAARERNQSVMWWEGDGAGV